MALNPSCGCRSFGSVSCGTVVFGSCSVVVRSVRAPKGGVVAVCYRGNDCKVGCVPRNKSVVMM